MRGTEEWTVFTLLRSAADPGRVWLGLENGLGAVRQEGGTWRFEGIVAGTPREIRTLVEGADGTVWCGSGLDGLAGAEIPAGWPAAAARVRRIAGGEKAFLFRIGGRIVAVQDGRILRLTRERVLVILADVDRNGAERIVQRILVEFRERFATLADPKLRAGYFEVAPGTAHLSVKQVLPAVFCADPAGARAAEPDDAEPDPEI